MKMIQMLLAMVTLSSSTFVMADAFDDKAAAVAAQQEQAAESKAYNSNYRRLVSDNNSIIRRIPRGDTITMCYNKFAMIYRKESNGCNLSDIVWNGIPVQICTEGYDQTLPPDIVECHYHVTRTGQDCVIYLNASIRPTCY